MAGSAEGAGAWGDWGNWAATWAEAQQRLWQNWMALAQPAAAQAAAGDGATAGWQDGPAQWLRLIQTAVSPAAPGFGGWFVEHWSAPLRLLGSLAAGRQGTTTAALPAADWIAAFTNAFTPFATGAGTAGFPQDALMRGIGTFWGLPIDMWRRLTSSLSALPGDAALGLKAGGISQPGALGPVPLERFLTIPPFGYTREWQEQGQQASRDWLAYQRAQGAYLGILTRIAVRTGEVVSQRLAARAAEAKPIQGLREAYDLFVDCAEDAYAEVVTAADFGKVSAELMNAAIALKRHAQAAMEETANAANLPTRRELDTQHRQGQTMRRQLVALQDELRSRSAVPAAADSTELDALRREVEALRAEVADLRGGEKSESAKGTKPARASAAGRAAKLENTEG
ncbi:MAG: class III poly(R)-hydroxyalkanoic acid synthase subunit PhaE [Defluviicoccus sp.]